MKFTANRRQLLATVQQAKDIIAKNPSAPIFEAVRMTATKDGLRVLGMSVGASLELQTQATVEKTGEINIDAGLLLRTLGAAVGDDAVFESKPNGRVLMTAGGAYTLVTIPGDMPVMPPVSGGDVFSVTSAFAEELARIVPAVPQQPGKYGLNGVLFEQGTTGLRIVGLDGNCLAWSECCVMGTVPTSRRRLMPFAALRTVIAMCTGEAATLTFADNGGEVRTNGATLRFRYLETDFPDYRQIVAAQRYTARADRDALISLAKQVRPLATDATTRIRVTFSPDSIRMAAATADAGEVTASMDATCDIDKPTRIDVNGEYLSDALPTLPAGELTVSFTDAVSFVSLTREGCPAFWTFGVLRQEGVA